MTVKLWIDFEFLRKYNNIISKSPEKSNKIDFVLCV